MKKYLFYGFMLCILIVMAGCNNSEEQPEEAAENAEEESTEEASDEEEGEEETADSSALTKQQEMELDELENGLSRDTADFLLEEFGTTSNIDAALIDEDYFILDKREINHQIMRFYKEPRHLVSEISQHSDDGSEANGLSVNIMGDMEEDAEATYIERLKDTKKILDFLFAYNNQEYDIHTVAWAYPIKANASIDPYSDISDTISTERVTREQYEKEWQNVDFDTITMNALRDMESAPVMDMESLYPFTDRVNRHDTPQETYEVNGLSVTLEEAERLDEYDGVSIEEFCAADDDGRSCNSFIKTTFVIKNDRDYDMTGFSTFMFGLGWIMDDGQPQDTSPLQNPANGFEFPNLKYDILVPAGEEEELEVVFADYDDVEHLTLDFNNFVFDSYTDETDRRAPVDLELNLSWMLEDILE